jgi:hypothetical protein
MEHLISVVHIFHNQVVEFESGIKHVRDIQLHFPESDVLNI